MSENGTSKAKAVRRDCSRGHCTWMSQIVTVVSIDDVAMRVGSITFQSNDVNGAQNSELLFCRSDM